MTVEIPQAGKYRVVTDQSEVRFAVKHRFGTGTVRGRFSITDGTVVVADPVSRSTVSVTADASSVESGNGGRDRTVRSATFLDSHNYPGISFRLSNIARADDGQWRLRGELTAHGVTATAEFTLTEARSSGRFVDFVADGSVDRYAYGVTAMKGMAGRHLHLTVVVHAERSVG